MNLKATVYYFHIVLKTIVKATEFIYWIIYINKNVNVRKFFTDCFQIWTQRSIRIRAFLSIYDIAIRRGSGGA
jgi:hypothetical protein